MTSTLNKSTLQQLQKTDLPNVLRQAIADSPLGSSVKLGLASGDLRKPIDVDQAYSWLQGRVDSGTAAPGEAPLLRAMQVAADDLKNAHNHPLTGEALRDEIAADVCKGSAPVQKVATPSRSADPAEHVASVIDQEPVPVGDTSGRKLDYVREGTPEGDWAKSLLAEVEPKTSGMNYDEAFRTYQTDRGLRVDGKPGPETLRRLRVDAEGVAAKKSDRISDRFFAYQPRASDRPTPSKPEPSAEPAPTAALQAKNSVTTTVARSDEAAASPVLVELPQERPKAVDKPIPEVRQPVSTTAKVPPQPAANRGVPGVSAEVAELSDAALLQKLDALAIQRERYAENVTPQDLAYKSVQKIKDEAGPYMKEASARNLFATITDANQSILYAFDLNRWDALLAQRTPAEVKADFQKWQREQPP